MLLPSDPTVSPGSFVVPRDHVGAAAYIVHMDWLTDPAVPVGQRSTPVTQARINVEYWLGYENRWDLLESPSTAAPVMLPPTLRALALSTRVGLPPDHPWQSHLPDW